MIPVEYSANNSGGRDWLTEKDWLALEKAGWKIYRRDDMAYRDGYAIPGEDGLPLKKDELPLEDQDEDKFKMPGERWQSYHEAYKLFPDIQTALKEFEEITGQDVTDEGCNCCGAPHSFTWGKDIIVRLPKDRLSEQDYNYGSGEDLLVYMYPDKPTNLSKRELLERSNGPVQ